jgi:hypothetical protein
MRRFFIVLATLLIVVSLLVMSSHGNSTTSNVTDGSVETPQGDPSDVQAATTAEEQNQWDAEWAKVFTWKGGGEGNFIRESERFTLNGGEQRVDLTVRYLTGQSAAPSADWTITGSGDFEMLSTTRRRDSVTLQLGGGQYQLEAYTLDCDWTLTIYERR